MYILEEFREVVQPDHPEEVNLGKCSDDVEFCVLWQLRLQFKREKSSAVPSTEYMSANQSDVPSTEMQWQC